MNKPLVSISCITYNHTRFIRQCIEGLLMQQCDFQYEILIHDDASTDDTADIIKEYEIGFPEIIKPIYQKENQYSKGIPISATYNWPRAQGKYIALCEGDDYWTDPLKLQKQVEFLEENQEYGMVHTNFSQLFQRSNKVIHNKNKNPVKEGWILNDIFLGKINIKTATVCFRTKIQQEYFPIDYYDLKIPIGDWPLWLVLAKHSKIKYFEDITVVYRVGQFSYVNYKAHNFHTIEKRYEDEQRMYEFMCNLYPEDLIYDPEGYFIFKNASLLNAAIKKNDFQHAKKHAKILKEKGEKSYKIQFSQYYISFKVIVLYSIIRRYARLIVYAVK